MKKIEIILIFFLFVIVSIGMFLKKSYASNDTITSTTYEIKDSTIYAKPTSNDLSVGELLENLTFSEVIDIYDSNNKTVDEDKKVGTDFKVKVSNKTYKVVVLGDVTGEGVINLGDVSRVYNHYKKKTSLNGSFLTAGKVTGNTSISFGDVSKLYNFYKGKSPFSYFSKDYPDGITNTVNKTVNTISDLRAYNASVGKVVKTKGYSSANDGGEAKYQIVKKSNQVIDNGLYILLDNGNVAQLIIGRQTVNVKQFGAKGDGTTNDSIAFNNAINSGAVTIKIPDGTYNMNNTLFTLTKFMRFVGNGETKTTVKNGTIKAPYGVSAEDITFDGGYTQNVEFTGVGHEKNGSVIFDVTPTGIRDVSYKNCTFKNVTVASYARHGSDIETDKTRLRNDTAKDCTFTNLRRVGIYHTVPLSNGTYLNNSFTNLGGSDMLRGIISGIFLGDVTNNTYFQADNILIKGNTFDNLVTKDNFLPSNEQEHWTNSNFIAIRGYNALIDNNTFTNLVGYGNDREGVYTKIQNLTISNNTLINAGFGEGYICAKAHDGEAVFNVINNNISGRAGTGIRTYGPGDITGNTINIENTPVAILATTSGTVGVGNTPLNVSGNTITSGTEVGINVNGTDVSDYSDDNKMVSLVNVQTPIILNNNTIRPTTSFKTYISIINPYDDVTIDSNKIYLSSNEGNDKAITITNSNDVYDTCLNNTTTISGNYFESSGNTNVFARVSYYQSSGKTTGRKIYLKNNNFNYTGSHESFYPFKYVTGSANNDKLFIEGNTTNTPKSNTWLSIDPKEYSIDNPDFARISYSYNY
ncbi:MAG: hypothetical protein IJS56_00310 [Bacilli bacterium]|nr:hypothetical protein [Bacilli bacterium]